MEWLNIHYSTLNSEYFLESDPTARGTWICLMGYSINQENGGRMVGLRLWNDRKCQQILRVTREELNDESMLWTWEGDDLLVTFYPADKEEEIKSKREAGRKGGRAKSKSKTEAARLNGLKHNPSTTQAQPKQAPNGKEEEEEGKGKEKKGTIPLPASGDAEGKVYITKLKKKLTGKRLMAFEIFWKCFAYPKGKAEAADSWLNIPELTNPLVATIFKAAERAAIERPAIIAAGKTPKYAQGWITARRWEDEEIVQSDPCQSRAPDDPADWQRLRDEVCDDLEAQGIPIEKLAGQRTETRYLSLKCSIRDDINAKIKETFA